MKIYEHSGDNFCLSELERIILHSYSSFEKPPTHAFIPSSFYKKLVGDLTRTITSELYTSFSFWTYFGQITVKPIKEGFFIVGEHSSYEEYLAIDKILLGVNDG